MSILAKLTARQMVRNRRRTIVTIIGVIISVAMFTACATLYSSFFDFMQRGTIAMTGDYHAAYESIDGKNIATIASDENTESYFVKQTTGYSPLKGNFGAKKYLSVTSISQSGMEDAGVHVTEGRLPQNNRELVVSQKLKDKNGDYYHIGDKIDLPLGYREDAEGNEYTGLLMMDEKFHKTETREYTIVGFASMIPIEGDTILPLYGAVTVLPEPIPNGELVTVGVKAKNVDPSLLDWAEELGERVGSNASLNSSLLLYNGVALNPGMQTMMITLIVILFLIIFVGSVALIYNAFAISITERSTSFGLLSSIGATKRQRRYTVFLEALMILVVSVPLGILGGYLGLWAVFTAVNPAVAEMATASLNVGGDGLQVVFSPWAVLIAVIVSVITVLVSAWVPAMRAGRVTPIEAIRQAKDVKLTAKEVKTSWLTRKLFGFAGELAVKNRKRNKKRYRVAIASFVVSLVLFLSASSFTHYFTQSVDLANSGVNFDIMVNAYNMMPEEESSRDERREHRFEFLEEVRALDGITDSVIMEESNLYPTGKMPMTAQTRELLGGQERGYRLCVLDDESLKAYCEKVGVSFEEMNDVTKEELPIIVVNELVWKEEGRYTPFSMLDVKAGETFTAQTEQYSSTGELQGLKDYHFAVVGVTGETTLGMTTLRYDGEEAVDVVMSRTVYEEKIWKKMNGYDTPFLYMNSNDTEQLADEIDDLRGQAKYTDLGSNTYDVSAEVRTMQQMIFMINTFSYVFIGLISAIGVANVFNTVSTSILLRRKEFAMLRSVGMAPSGFRRMLWFESLFYGVRSLLWGLPLSGVAMGLIYWALRKSFDISFSIPWVQAFIGIGAIFLIVIATTFYSARKVRSGSIIDSLRKTNL